MDGLDASDPDQPTILAATTGQRVRRNLVESLRSHKRQGANIRARHVVVATTQVATGTLIDDLRGAAAGEGFQLINVHGQRAFADLLYRSSHWTSELLGLSGEPSALSAIPVSSRTMNSLPLIGRDADIQWLANSSGDIVVSGYPASGKTHLLRQFVDEGWLFMVDADRERVANAVRDRQPGAIIVDDAHSDLNSLGTLRQLRDEIGAGFRIVAVTWPGDLDGVTSTLAVPPSSVLDLRPLSLDEILEIVKAAGIAGPVELQRAIVNQSGSRPGLTATLCDVAWRGDLHALLSGELLLREIGTALTRVSDSDGMQVLAVMALAGDSGASLDDVANVLRLDMAKSKRSLALLGHTGVFRAVSLTGKATIWPKELRFAAVGEAFFSETPYQNLPLTCAMRHLDERGIAGSLVGAALMGANIPSDTIEPILRSSGSIEDLKGYARIGAEQASFALTSRSEWLTKIAPHALLTNPAETLRMLLERAVGDRRPQHSHAGHPLRIVKDWVESAPFTKGTQIERREILADVMAIYAKNDGDPQVLLEGLCLAMDPRFESTSPDAGSGHTWTIRSGLVSHECLKSLVELWPTVLESIPMNGPHNWSKLLGLLHDWVYHGGSQELPPQDVQTLMRAQASRMANDIAAHMPGHPGVLARIDEFSREADLGVQTSVPHVFAVLYPSLDYSVCETNGMEGIEAQGRALREAIQRLAADLEPQGPGKVLPLILDANKRAAEASVTWPDMTGEFSEEIARRTSDPYAWAARAACGGMSPVVVEPLLRAARSKNREQTLPLMIYALTSETCQRAAVIIVLTSEDALDSELDAALDVLPGLPLSKQLINGIVPRIRGSTPTLRRLLHHPSPEVAEATAVGLRMSGASPSVPEHLFDDWKAAVLRSPGKDCMFPLILKDEITVFYEWLMGRIEDGNVGSRYGLIKDLDGAFEKLSVAQRVNALSAIHGRDSFYSAQVVSKLVGDNMAVFEQALAMDSLGDAQESIFASVSDSKVKAAYRAGWPPERIARAIISPYGIMSISRGSESEYWMSKCKYFEELAKSVDVGLAAIGNVGVEVTRRSVDTALRRKRERDGVRGVDRGRSCCYGGNSDCLAPWMDGSVARRTRKRVMVVRAWSSRPSRSVIMRRSSSMQTGSTAQRWSSRRRGIERGACDASGCSHGRERAGVTDTCRGWHADRDSNSGVATATRCRAAGVSKGT